MLCPHIKPGQIFHFTLDLGAGEGGQSRHDAINGFR